MRLWKIGAFVGTPKITAKLLTGVALLRAERSSKLHQRGALIPTVQMRNLQAQIAKSQKDLNVLVVVLDYLVRVSYNFSIR